jgi:hypothetical protein
MDSAIIELIEFIVNCDYPECMVCPAIKSCACTMYSEHDGRVSCKEALYSHYGVVDYEKSKSCMGVNCKCGKPASRKVGEEILWGDKLPNRHNCTAYICQDCFDKIFGAK